MKHVLYTDDDQKRPNTICDYNGQTVLAMCKICGMAESDLNDTPECPGPSVHMETCPTCGGQMVGDGYTVLRHCENSDPPDFIAPDSGIFFCDPKTQEDCIEPDFEFSDECTYDSNCPHCKALYKNHDTINMVTLPEDEYEALIKLTTALLHGANLCMKEQALIQPFFSIVLKNSDTIGKYKFFDMPTPEHTKYIPLTEQHFNTLLSNTMMAITTIEGQVNTMAFQKHILASLTDMVKILQSIGGE